MAIKGRIEGFKLEPNSFGENPTRTQFVVYLADAEIQTEDPNFTPEAKDVEEQRWPYGAYDPIEPDVFPNPEKGSIWYKVIVPAMRESGMNPDDLPGEIGKIFSGERQVKKLGYHRRWRNGTGEFIPDEANPGKFLLEDEEATYEAILPVEVS